jgi:hypothetical protein
LADGPRAPESVDVAVPLDVVEYTEFLVHRVRLVARSKKPETAVPVFINQGSQGRFLRAVDVHHGVMIQHPSQFLDVGAGFSERMALIRESGEPGGGFPELIGEELDVTEVMLKSA